MKSNICEPDALARKLIKRLVIVVGLTMILLCCAYQYFYYHGLSKIDISKFNLEPNGFEYSFDEINYKDPDNDYIRGYLSLDGKAITKCPTKIVFYIDDSNVGYSIPIKLSNVDAEGEAVDGAYNDGLYANKTYFDVLIDRFSGFRNEYKIAFLIDIDGQKYLIKTGEVYKYSDI